MTEPHRVGRYEVHREIAAGVTASVHLGRLVGEIGFSRAVAIKRLRPGLDRDGQRAKMLLDEARVAARIRHPNVVPVLDVVLDGDEVLLVMEYVHGESLSRLLKETGGKPLQPAIAVSILAGTLYGLHAAHEARDLHGRPLCVVHCDVAPQNILVGADGVARVTDFGIARAQNRSVRVNEDYLRTKIAYLSPEQLSEQAVDRRVDVYSASVVLWEMLTGRRLFEGPSWSDIALKILASSVVPPTRINPSVPRSLDEVVMRGLSTDPGARYGSAREMAVAVERAVVPAPAALVADFVERTARVALRERNELLLRVEGAGAHRYSRPPPPRRESPLRPPPPRRESPLRHSPPPHRPAPPRTPRRVGWIVALGTAAIALGAAATWWLAHPKPDKGEESSEAARF